MPGIRLSDRSEDGDVATLSQWWRHGRSLASTEQIVANSMNFTAIDETSGEQIGYGRAVADHAPFAWLTDVVVRRSWRGRGVGTALVGFACQRLDALGVRRVALATEDAHGFCSRFAFEAVARPERSMLRVREPIAH